MEIELKLSQRQEDSCVLLHMFSDSEDSCKSVRTHTYILELFLYSCLAEYLRKLKQC